MKRAVFTKSIAALIFASAFIFGGTASAQAKAARQQEQQNQCAGKIARPKIVEWLASDDVSQGQIINFVKQCGVDFPLTEAARGELTKAGARAGLLDAIAENYRPNAAVAEKPPPTAAPPIPDKTPTAAPTPGAEKTSPPVPVPTPVSEKPKPVAPSTISAPPIGKPNAQQVAVKETVAPQVKENTPQAAAAAAADGDTTADKYQMPNYNGSPVNKAGLIKVLKGATFNAKEVIKVIEEHGVSFPMTLGIEKELFQAASGAGGKSPYSDEDWQSIIATVWENFRSDKIDNPDLVKAIRLYQTSAGANLSEKIALKSAALDLFKKQEAKQPPDAQMLYFIAETYNELASLKYQDAFSHGYPTDKQAAEYGKLFDGSIEYHKKNVAANPNYADSWEKLAELYGRLKMYPEAIAAYKKLAEFEPKEVSYWIIIGDYYTKQNDFKSALESKKRARLLLKGRDLQLNKDIDDLEKKVAGGQ